MTDSTPVGQFVWYELYTSDVEAAKSFYADLIGWTVEEAPDAPNPYWLFKHDGQPVAGVMAMPEKCDEDGNPIPAGSGEGDGSQPPPIWSGYVSTPDVDAVRAAIEADGGRTVMGPMDMPNVGRIAFMTDPSGVGFAAYRPAMAIPEPSGPAGVGRVSWHELETTDSDAAFDFYVRHFGWIPQQAVDMGEGRMYRMFGHSKDAPPVGGICPRAADATGQPFWRFHFRVPDVDAAAERVKSLGGRLLFDPIDAGGGDRITHCFDPQGAAFALHSNAGGS